MDYKFSVALGPQRSQGLTIRGGEPRTATSTLSFTQLLSSGLLKQTQQFIPEFIALFVISGSCKNMTMSSANAAGHQAPCTSDVMNKAGMHVAKVSNNCVMSKLFFAQ